MSQAEVIEDKLERTKYALGLGKMGYFFKFILLHFLFCRLPCTTWAPLMATTLTRTRGGEKNKRSPRWMKFELLLNFSALEHAGWEDGDGQDGPDVPLPLPLLLPHLQHGLLAQLPLDISVIRGGRGWWELSSVWFGRPHPTQSVWSVDLANYPTQFLFQKIHVMTILRSQSKNVKWKMKTMPSKMVVLSTSKMTLVMGLLCWDKKDWQMKKQNSELAAKTAAFVPS